MAINEATAVAEPQTSTGKTHGGFVRELKLFDGTMIVARLDDRLGCLHRLRGHRASDWLAAGLLAAWIAPVCSRRSPRCLAANSPECFRRRADNVYLRETYSPLFGFLYGWALFLVIQTGTIAAVGVAFAEISGCSLSRDLADRMDHQTDQYFAELRGSVFRGSN